MYELTVEMQFPAAHCIPEHPGRCARLHGHSYRALITVVGKALNAQGMLMDFGDLKTVCQQVIDPLDHQYLNELPVFTDTVPTAEAIARYLYQQIRIALSERVGVQLARVTVYESERSFAIYWE